MPIRPEIRRFYDARWRKLRLAWWTAGLVDSGSGIAAGFEDGVDKAEGDPFLGVSFVRC